MLFGSKYRLPNKFAPESIINSIFTDLDKFIYSLAVAFSLPIQAFNSWKLKFSEHYIQIMKKNFIRIKHNSAKFNKAIQLLQKDFVITYVDKASSNFAFICKASYVQQLALHLGSNKIFQPPKDNIAVVSKKKTGSFQIM